MPGEVTGAPIVGRAAHSEVFIPDSGAWLNIYGVLTGGPVRPDAGHRDDSPPVPDREPAVTWVRAAPTRCGKKDPYPTRPPRPRPLAP